MPVSEGRLGWLGDAALFEVVRARQDAVRKHGVLKPGADRWMRLLGEEWEEVQDELMSLHQLGSYAKVPGGDGYKSNVRKRAIAELAQLSQLAIGVIEQLQQEEANVGR